MPLAHLGTRQSLHDGDDLGQIGQVLATCFDDSAAPTGAMRRVPGGCAVLTVELDKRPGEDTPTRLDQAGPAIRGLANTARLLLDLAVDDAAPCPVLAEHDRRSNAAGAATVRLWARSVSDGGEAELVLGRDFRSTASCSRGSRDARRALGEPEERRSDARGGGVIVAIPAKAGTQSPKSTRL
jgi:hypothetical protein